MLQKAGENDNADSEFCEGRRSAFVNKGSNYFSHGVIYRARNHMITAMQIQMIMRLPQFLSREPFFSKNIIV